MPLRPNILELKRTRDTMEERLLAQTAKGPSTTYLQLKARFESDLADERDQLLSQCAALMVLAHLQRDNLLKS